MKKVKKIALSGILVALSIVILTLGSLIETLDMTVAAIAAFVITVAIRELSGKYPMLIYACTSLIGILILPNKYGVLMYVLFYGYYPVVKVILEAKVGKKLRLFFKFLLFAVSMAATELLYVLLFAKDIQSESLSLLIPLFILAMITFFIFDIALTKLLIVYEKVWRKNIEKFLK